ncbi:hypothetical protein GIB67_000966 [Kingdonia uniflora]|uniref:serine O-acetyltransferase n=1 Tax=Kingdonia uniflora TaxID=39325 RepID=A0A7J7MFP8_9MAGN|nr:hypothetical protein GIB67_000966 [Kingdonia uniflora]
MATCVHKNCPSFDQKRSRIIDSSHWKYFDFSRHNSCDVDTCFPINPAPGRQTTNNNSPFFDGDVLWLKICEEARSDMKQEPILSNYYVTSILSHDSLVSALANHLGSKLSTSTLSSSVLSEVFLSVMGSDTEIRIAIIHDLKAVKERDPACVSLVHCMLNFKGFLACQAHRVAHKLWTQGRKVLALVIQNRVSEAFAVDIHPGAKIGHGILLDHATGVVIGETAVIGNNVSILHNVTLGGTGKASGDRHPKIGDGVLVGAGTSVLGNVRIGDGAKIGAGSLVLKEVPPRTTAVGNPARLIGDKLDKSPSLTMDHTSFAQECWLLLELLGSYVFDAFVEMVGLSIGEKHFIEGGIAQDLRTDGRKRWDYRPLSIETGVIPQASGSARVRMGGTDVIASVKAELGKPNHLHPDKGKVSIFVDCSPIAAPMFEGRGGEELSAELSLALQRCLLGGKSGAGAGINLSSLIVAEGKICWDLYIDGLVVSSDGNLLDALSAAIKAALSNTGIPKVNVAIGASADEQPEVDISDEEFLQFDTSEVPVIITLTKVGGQYYIVDATSEEESQMSSAISVSINRRGHICGLTKRGGAGLDPSVILDMVSVAKRLSEQLMIRLDSEISAAEAYEDLAKKHGLLLHIQLGEVSAIVISSSTVAKEVMKTHDLTFVDRHAILVSYILSYGNKGIAFSPYGDYWRQLQKFCILELLSAKRVSSFGSIREDEVSNLIQRIISMGGSLINMSESIRSLTNEITSKVAFGKQCKDSQAFLSAVDEMLKMASGFDICDIFPLRKYLHVISGTKQKLEKLHQKIDMIFNNIIIEHAKNRTITKSDPDEFGEDLVDVLLRIQKNGELSVPFATDNIKAVMLDIFTAGSETSSTAIEWALSEIMRNPRVMKKVQSEVRQVVNGKRNVLEVDVHELNYLKLVIKEVLRLHPPLPLLVPRECREKCEINGYEIPVKTKVIVNAWAIGRDPEHWRNAESFEPERFEDGSIDYKGMNFEYIPFGAGRRICPVILFGAANIELPLAQYFITLIGNFLMVSSQKN